MFAQQMFVQHMPLAYSSPWKGTIPGDDRLQSSQSISTCASFSNASANGYLTANEVFLFK